MATATDDNAEIRNLDARLFEKSTCWHNSIKRKKMERLYKKLESYGQSDYYPFHMPGHKRNRASSADDFLFERDITEISGFDNLHHAEGILKEAQEYAAQIYGTKKCFFSVNGSTAALLAAVSASVNKGGKILVARNCHKAVYHALYLRELQPVYIYPHEDQRLGINGGISPERVERYLEENTDVLYMYLNCLPDNIFEYKKASIEDIDELVRTRIIVLRAANKLSDDEDMSVVEEESYAYYRRALETGEHIAYLVYDNGKFIGAGGVSFYQIMPTYHNPTGKKAYIMNMYTAPEYRRQGIAFHTLDLLVKDAKEQGVLQIALEATDMGRPLYERYGFVKMEDEMELI